MADGKTSVHTVKNTSKRACALLWDESLAWGLMARESLKKEGLPFDLLDSAEIRGGALSRYRMLFVPGGWASNKLRALEDRGCREIRRFVEEGGSYLGICGGAGMATEEGIGLLPVRRKPSAERVASFSGPIRLSLKSHRFWRGIEEPRFHAWWPSQFQASPPGSSVLATYEEALPGAFSSDIPVADGRIIGWSGLEARYGILLDPARLQGEPAVMEGRLGLGHVVLSYIHFDTPGDPNGAVVLRNLWNDLAPGWSSDSPSVRVSSHRRPPSFPPELVDSVGKIMAAVTNLIEWGTKQSLWDWRNPWVLQWRRGVRGLEYGTLAVMIGEIAKRLNPRRTEGVSAVSGSMDVSRWLKDLETIRSQLMAFLNMSEELLAKERIVMQTSPLSPLECADPEISRLRRELFGTAMSHGGRFKQLIDVVARLLFDLMRDDRPPQ